VKFVVRENQTGRMDVRSCRQVPDLKTAPVKIFGRLVEPEAAAKQRNNPLVRDGFEIVRTSACFPHRQHLKPADSTKKPRHVF
jgi:hypothetical protein